MEINENIKFYVVFIFWFISTLNRNKITIKNYILQTKQLIQLANNIDFMTYLTFYLQLMVHLYF